MWRRLLTLTCVILGVLAIGSALSCSSRPQNPATQAQTTNQPKDLQIFLAFGQSNMEGVPKPQAQDQAVHPRLFVLAYDAKCHNRTYNEWAPAFAPLHHCSAGVGPGDWFARTLADAWPSAKIGIVPAAISGVDIDFFRKGVVSKRRKEFQIPPDNHDQSAYDMLVERARLAQQRGTIRGIIFHQGESDNGDGAWVDKVKQIVADLRQDLHLGDDVPFLAGELPFDACCGGHNELVRQLPNVIPGAYVVSARDLTIMDQYHFDLSSQRELGRRYASLMLDLIPAP